MIIHTVIGNRAHPEYGVASIPFPISTEEYPRIMEMIEALEVGDVSTSIAMIFFTLSGMMSRRTAIATCLLFLVI